MSVYDLDSLGWLLYERLATDAVERELAVPASAWQGSSDELREALWDGAVLRMVWWRGEAPWPENSHVIVTNADEEKVPDGDGVRVLGRRWLSAALDRSGELRAAHPSALGGSPVAAATPTFDVAAAQALARVFVPVGAHARTLEVLGRHRFAVLTGPPEMGKTAVARMVALALVTDGWEAHECTRPEDVWSAWADERAQVFVADDAFGSTEYRPDSGERWARDMERLLRSLDDRHVLIWTSRPAPLRAGLARIHRERGAERFPQPAGVLVDAAALDRAEKALILFRHAKAAGASGTEAAQLVRAHGDAIVENEHFTPERIRRFASGRLLRLDAGAAHAAVGRLLRDELREPTEAMAASFAALDGDHRAVLVAMLDCAPAMVAERDLAAAARRHAEHGLPQAPADLMDRLADHFLRVSDTNVGWVHPSWRDLVIDQLTADPAGRRAFLERAGIEGLLLGLSTGGGRQGERAFPLLVDDADWDLIGDRLATLVRDTDDHDTQRVLLAIAAAFDEATPLSPARAELRAVAEAVLGTVRRRWDRAHAAVPVAPLVAWLQLAAWTGGDEIPHLERTWFAVLPAAEGEPSDDELRMADDWLWLVRVLYDLRPEELEPLHFPDAHRARVEALAGAVEDDERPLAASVRRRLASLHLLSAGVPDTLVLEPEPAEAPGEPPGPSDWTGESTVARILRDL